MVLEHTHTAFHFGRVCLWQAFAHLDQHTDEACGGRARGRVGPSAPFGAHN